MKKLLLIAFAVIMTAGLLAQSPYKGKPWNGTPWEFKADNSHNFGPNGRVILWKYDIGPAINPAPEETGNQPSDGGDFVVEPHNNLEWVTGMRDGRWRVRTDDETRRLDSAAALEIELDPTDISLMDGENGWSNFNWDPVKNRPRDGGIWPRFTVNFEKGKYRFINRGFPNTNGNFNIYIRLRDTATMEVVHEIESFNNLGDLGTVTTALGQDPGTETHPRYALLPNTEDPQQVWYAANKVFDLEGPFIFEFVLHGSGASGGQASEFTWENLPENAPGNLTLVSAGDIQGCDGSTVLTASADEDPEAPGATVEYKFSRGGYTLQDWSADTDLEVFWPGEYKVHARLVDYVVEVEASVMVSKVGCAPTPYGGTAQAIPGMLEFEYFDLGGDGVAYNEVNSPLVNDKSWMQRNGEERGLMGVDLDSTGVDTIAVDNTINNVVSRSSDAPANINKGEWFVYSVSVGEAADYSVNLKYNSDGTNTSKTIWMELWEDDLSAIVDSFYFPVTGTWDIFGHQDSVPEGLLFADKWWDTTFMHAVALPAGDFKMRLSPGTNNMNLDKLTFAKLDPVAPVVNVELTEVMQTVPFALTAGNKNVLAYLVPRGTAADAASIRGAAVDMLSIWVDQKGESGAKLATDEVAAGDYTFYGIDNIDQVSAGVDVTVLALERPTVTLSADRVLPGFPIQITMSTDGIVRVYPEGTDAIATDTVDAILVDTCMANTPLDFSTAGLDTAMYVIFGTSTEPASMGVMSEAVGLEITVHVGVEEDRETEQISVYPTLVDNQLFVYTSSPAAEVEIFSIVGVRVRHLSSFGGGGIDLSELQDGMYVVRVTADRQRDTVRIIKR